MKLKNNAKWIGSAVFITLITTACSTTQTNKSSQAPSWILNPGNGVSESADVHAKGRHAQEHLAISRARDEYAKRFGVQVDSVTILHERISDNEATVSAYTNSAQTTKASLVRAKIKEKWIESGTGKLWVWLVPYD